MSIVSLRSEDLVAAMMRAKEGRTNQEEVDRWFAKWWTSLHLAVQEAADNGNSFVVFDTPVSFEGKKYGGRSVRELLEERFAGCWVRFQMVWKRGNPLSGRIVIGWVASEEDDFSALVDGDDCGGALLANDDDW